MKQTKVIAGKSNPDMDDENEMNRAIERLKQVKWHKDFYYDNYETCKLLVREWLRRMALWGKALNATHKWPFISIAGKIFGESEIYEPVIKG